MPETPPHVERMIQEQRELVDRIDKLDEFINGTDNGVYHSLPMVSRLLLDAQLGAMQAYNAALSARLAL